jgi:hypothetical protein
MIIYDKRISPAHQVRRNRQPFIKEDNRSSASELTQLNVKAGLPDGWTEG